MSQSKRSKMLTKRGVRQLGAEKIHEKLVGRIGQLVQ